MRVIYIKKHENHYHINICYEILETRTLFKCHLPLAKPFKLCVEENIFKIYSDKIANTFFPLYVMFNE